MTELPALKDRLSVLDFLATKPNPLHRGDVGRINGVYYAELKQYLQVAVYHVLAWPGISAAQLDEAIKRLPAGAERLDAVVVGDKLDHRYWLPVTFGDWGRGKGYTIRVS
jgi:hypothetical protein